MATRQTVLRIAGMHCASCGMLIDEALEDLPGVRRSTTKLRKATTVVDHDDERTGVQELVHTITELGYTATPGA